MIKDYRDLNIWKKSIDLVEMIYNATSSFPKEEIYSLTQQLKRAAVSVPSNIAERYERNTTKEYIQFLRIAKGSLAELNTQLIIALRRNFLKQETYLPIASVIEDVNKMIYSLIQKLKGNLT